VKIQQVLSALEQFAPLPLQESWDNAGLQIGLTEAEVSGALLCLDVTEKVIDEAIAKGCNLVVSHHPLLFRGLKQVSDANDVQRTVRKAIKNDICVISMHTNMDNARGGVNFKIAEKLGAKCHTEGKGHTENTEITERRIVDDSLLGWPKGHLNRSRLTARNLTKSKQIEQII
jgi:dinuclear metal center YbgI/SA1388 family protein